MTVNVSACSSQCKYVYIFFCVSNYAINRSWPKEAVEKCKTINKIYQVRNSCINSSTINFLAHIIYVFKKDDVFPCVIAVLHITNAHWQLYGLRSKIKRLASLNRAWPIKPDQSHYVFELVHVWSVRFYCDHHKALRWKLIIIWKSRFTKCLSGQTGAWQQMESCSAISLLCFYNGGIGGYLGLC